MQFQDNSFKITFLLKINVDPTAKHSEIVNSAQSNVIQVKFRITLESHAKSLPSYIKDTLDIKDSYIKGTSSAESMKQKIYVRHSSCNVRCRTTLYQYS